MKPPLKEIARDLRNIEPFPNVALRVLEIAAGEEVVPGELIEMIQFEAGITSKVLRLCNSAYYGFQREISTITEAGNMLGVRTLVNLVLTSSTNKYFRDYGQSTGQTQADLWKQSVTLAIAARLIAERQGTVDKERAYTAGLLQNIGNLVLDRYVEDGQSMVLAVAAKGYPLIEAEKYALGLHHAEIGARLATRWQLPLVITDTIRHHHAPEAATVDPFLAATVHLAETAAAREVAPEDSNRLAYEISDAALELTNLTARDFEYLGVELGQELAKAQELFEIA